MSLFPEIIQKAALEIVESARQKKIRIVTAESCTGGLLSACLTDVPGSSDVFDRGFVTYANDAKMAQLDVERKTIGDFGAVSAETAVEMAEGALRASHADIAVSITGVAGPDGGTAEKPVGTVFIAIAHGRDEKLNTHTRQNLSGTRGDIRLSSVAAALAALQAALQATN